MIENGYIEYKDEELNLIFDFIKNKLIPENYSFLELEIFFFDIN